MRVAVLGSYAASLVRFRGQLIEQMTRAGHTVVGCSPEFDPWVERTLRSLGASYVSIPLARAGLNPLADVTTLVRLTAFFREWRPDLLLAYTQKPVIYGCLAARAAKVPKIYALITGLGFSFGEGTGLKRRLIKEVSRTLYWLALRGVDGVFFQNPDDQADFSRLGVVSGRHRLLQVSGSGVDTIQFSYVPPSVQPLTFLMIARLIGDKGVRDYAEAARRMRATHPQVRCQLVGPFDANPTSLRPEEVQRWQAEGVVDYLGETQDVRPFLAQSSVFVLPSYYREGVPRANLEAMAIGRPIITTDMPGCRETVREAENGFLVPPRDPAALARAMARFAASPALVEQMGRRSRALAEERFDVRLVNAAMLGTLGLT